MGWAGRRSLSRRRADRTRGRSSRARSVVLTGSGKKILFLAEGVTMAHFTRPAVLAEALNASEFTVVFRTPERYHPLLSSSVANRGDLRTIDPAVFLSRLANGDVLYDEETIQQYVEDELQLFAAEKPDLVIGDYRLSLGISGPVSGIPFASIFNAYWSVYAQQPAILPEIPLTRVVPASLLNPVYRLIRPLFYALHAKPLNRVRQRYGLKALRSDIREFYLTGDMVLYPDVPEMVVLNSPPSHHHFIGPCLWEDRLPDPNWWNDAVNDPRPKVFVALGSSGPVRLLSGILEALSGLPVAVIVATSGREMTGLGDGVYSAPLLPYAKVAGISSVVVSHGGSSGVYPALAAGAPVLALPSNIDTHLSADVLRASGGGIVIRAERANPRTVADGVKRLLNESEFSRAAKAAQANLLRSSSSRLFPQRIRNFFEKQNGLTR